MNDRISLPNPNSHAKHLLRCLECGKTFSNGWIRSAASKLAKHRRTTGHRAP